MLYLRKLTSGKVYGFGEHPGKKYAYVLSGTVSGDRVTGSWWDVPKGTRAKSGTLELRWSQGGERIVRSGGDDFDPDVFTALPSSVSIPWPNQQAAGFQATSVPNLDGVFLGDDGSRHYVRERSSTVVWVAERQMQPGDRPGWATVFVGMRKPGGGFSGTYADVPKGLERASGNFGAALIGGEALRPRGAELRERSAFDRALR